MTSKSRIAIAVAAVFLGAQIGMAALSELQQREAAATETLEQETAAAEQEGSAETAAAEAPADAAAAQEAQRVAQAEPVAVEFPQRNYFAEALAEARLVERVVPAAAHDHPPMLPATLAYLERRDAGRHLVAGPVESVIPAAYDVAPMLPATLAYLERRQATALAAAAPANEIVAAAPAAQ
jgi:hypothetical protein